MRKIPKIFIRLECFRENDEPSISIMNMPIIDNSICQLRLDFLDFEMDRGSEPDKPCDRDSMQIISAATGAGGKLIFLVIFECILGILELE